MTDDLSNPPRRRSMRIMSGLWAKVIAPVAVGAILLFIGVAWGRHDARPTETERVLFHPNGYEIPSSLKITERIKGAQCFVNLSIANQGMPEAHRCFSGNGIYDPCWGGATGIGEASEVVCAGDPWSREVTVLRVARWKVFQRSAPYSRNWHPSRDRDLLVSRRPNHSAPPWAMQLMNGERCVFATGTAEIIGGVRANYFCERGSAVGLPNRRQRLWTIPYIGEESAETEPVEIEKVWF